MSAPQIFLERSQDLLAVRAVFHVDEIDDNDAAKIANPQLANNLLDRFQIRIDDRIFQPVGLADVLSRVDINGDPAPRSD